MTWTRMWRLDAKPVGVQAHTLELKTDSRKSQESHQLRHLKLVHGCMEKTGELALAAQAASQHSERSSSRDKNFSKMHFSFGDRFEFYFEQ